jgi:hypothetical protein
MKGSSDHVRALAAQRYVQPALREGKTHFSVAVKDVLRDLAEEGFPLRNIPQVCTALRTEKFLQSQGIEIEDVDGPPSKLSSTVVYRYRVANRGRGLSHGDAQPVGAIEEDPDVWAERVTSRIRGLLKDEIAQFGGAEGFIRWVRGHDEDSE